MPEPASPPFPGPSSRALPPLDLQSHLSRSRRMSTGSASSDDTDVPSLSALDSSAALILVHDSDESTPFDFSDDDDDDEDEIDAPSPLFEIRRASIPPLPPTIVFLYLLAPYLKLGAMFLPYTRLPLKYGLSELLVFAVLAAFARHVWYMLARYLRKADIEDIVLDTFARGRGKERQREILRSLVRAGTGTINVLLATTYLRGVYYIGSLSIYEYSFPLRICPCYHTSTTTTGDLSVYSASSHGYIQSRHSIALFFQIPYI